MAPLLGREENFQQDGQQSNSSSLYLVIGTCSCSPVDTRLMASPDVSGPGEANDSLITTTDVSPFEESQIASIVTADDAPAFFKEHGVFYKADAEIGRQARALEHNKDMRKELLMKDPVSITI